MIRIFKLILLIACLLIIFIMLANAAPQTLVLPLDCRKSSIQSGVPVRRNSDGRITRVDVCGAADSPVDTFRDIPYEAHCEEFETGTICR